MKLEIKKISISLNRTYRYQNIFDEEIAKFKQNFKTFLSSINASDSEETLKDYINDFLKNTYYKNNYFTKVNPNNIDLVINSGKNSEDNIAVIIETKSLKNNTEMITTMDINKKAFHEILQYYFEERITNSNFDIKHLIITNSIEWFIFDASEIEKHFYQNKQFQKNYVDWTQGNLPSKNKDWFYNEIAKNFIANYEGKIFCTHLVLPSFENLSVLSEIQWIELYKIFSPEHLLKLPFANDSNTLNSEFYNELLHIIGLHEINDKIERLPQKLRHSGSLLENTINVLLQDEILDKVENTPSYENLFELNKDDQLFSIALELCIIWLNRIIFLKLLESQIIKYNKNKDLAFLNIKTIKNFDDLKELFFEVLSIQVNERKEDLNKKYENIPYLNSSLFEANQIEKDTIRINQLKHAAELPVFSATVLKDESGKKIAKKQYFLEYLFEFLDSYNFASDPNLEIQQSNKTIINSAVLGLIFEKINGYQDGSFFTPGNITMYICRETIRKAVIEKFKTIQGFENILRFEDLYNQIGKIPLKQANEIFNSIKICDPSVGSGHFLVSALNELVVIKSELDIITDRDGKTLRNTYCEVENDEILVTHKAEVFVYDFKDKESQRIQETLFAEKQILIENCLFGVDINPKSVSICRLRLWIELLKNAYYTRQSNYKELETLPNIDINIKCGNSLVSKFALNGNGTKNTELKAITQQYKQDVNNYKITNNRVYKKTIVKTLKEIKETFTNHSKPTDEDFKKIKDLNAILSVQKVFFNEEEKIQWDMKITRLKKELNELQTNYNKKLKSIYGNSLEWRYEFPEVLDENGYFEGFDAVIGNPPYGVKVNNLCVEYFKNHYESTKTITKIQKGSTDTFVMFIEKAYNLVKKNGLVHFIVPISLTAADSMVALHNLLENNCETIKTSSYAVRPQPIFDNAVVDVSMIEFKKTFTKCKHLYSTKMHRKSKNFDFNELLNNLKFIDVLDIKSKGRIPKISFKIEKNILKKLFAIENKIKNEIVEKNGEKIYYRASGGRYFKVITNYSTGSNSEKFLLFDKKYSNTIAAIMSSNLFFWYYQIYSDNHSLKLSDLLGFPFPKNNLNNNLIKKIELVYKEYLIDIEKNANIRNTTKYKNMDTFKEYKIGKSKHLIDKIDDLIGNAYGFDNEEIEFVKNYEIEFRLQLEIPKNETT